MTPTTLILVAFVLGAVAAVLLLATLPLGPDRCNGHHWGDWSDDEFRFRGKVKNQFWVRRFNTRQWEDDVGRKTPIKVRKVLVTKQRQTATCEDCGAEKRQWAEKGTEKLATMSYRRWKDTV